MQAEVRAWTAPIWRSLLASAWHRPTLKCRMNCCLAATVLVLWAARVLLGLRLITPEVAGTAFNIATLLSRKALGLRPLRNDNDPQSSRK